MPVTTYRIVLRGCPSARLLRPLLDDFTVDHTAAGVTRLVGEIADASALHGVLTHLTSVNVDVVCVMPLDDPVDQHLDSKGTPT
jgi:hypothetical protein